MKGRLKKIISFLLVTAIALPFADLTSVYASTQMNVPDLSIVRSGGTDTSHNVMLSWGQITNNSFNPAIDNDPTNTYEAYGVAGYDLSYYNATTNSTPIPIPSPPVPPTTGITVNSVGTTPGSLVAFKVNPYHYEKEFVGGQVSGQKKVYPPVAGMSEALLLTDIEVDAVGSNNTLEITWDNPTYKNAQAFPQYKIYVARAASAKSATPITVNANQCERIAADPVTGRGPRLSYKIIDAAKIYSGIYSVAVEPCDVAGNIVRANGTSSKITIGGVTYPLTYSQYANSYENTNVSVALSLSLIEAGKDVSLISWGDISYLGNIRQIAIFTDTDKQKLEEALITYSDPTAPSRPVPLATLSTAVTTSYPIVMQDRNAYYGIVVEVMGQQTSTFVISDVLTVVPTTMEITPNTPDIHVPLSANAAKTEVKLYWDAFLREPYFPGDTIKEITFDGKTYNYDTDVIYEVTVVDNLDTFSLRGVPTAVLNSSALGDAAPHEKIENSGVRVPSYSYTVTKFADINGQEKVFERNKLYYVKVVAKKQKTASSGGIEYSYSQPSYATIYIPIEGDISSPSMIQKPPLRVRLDADESEVVTETTIDVQWLEQWTEVFDKTTNSTNPPEWQTKAAKDGSVLYYGDDSKGMTDLLVDFASQLNIDTARSLLGLPASVPARTLDIRNSSYEAKAIPYNTFISTVEALGGYEQYLESLMREEVGTNNWEDFDVERVDEENNSVNPYMTITGLATNQTYAILVRPYRTAPDGTKNKGYANFIVASTVPPLTEIDITPTTPVVEAVSSTDTTATVRWRDSVPVEFELVYSDAYLKDIEAQYGSATPVTRENVMKYSTLKLENNISYRYLTITGLFPDTEYNFWVRAISKTNKISYFSNPATIKTKEMGVINPPAGFGLASNDDVKLINLADKTDYTAKNKNYLILQWLKDTKDPKEDGTGAGSAVAEILTEPSITESYLAKFNGLVSNQIYYFRAKTIANVTKGADGKTTAAYTYVVQMSEEPDFVNVKEIYVPNDLEDADPSSYRRAESAWTNIIYYRTEMSTDEYDSDFDPDLYPLPQEDFELIYDNANGGTFFYKFRTDGKDEQGNYNNRVDQRFITKLITSKVHNYNIDLTKFENHTIKNRVVEIPYSIMKALDERKISFGIRAGDVTVIIPPGVMETQQVKGIRDYGDNANLRVTFIESPSSMPSLGAKDSYAMKPQSVTLTVTSPTYSANMQNVGKPLGVRLKLDNPSDTLDANIGAYAKNEATEGWSRVNASYDKENGQLEFETSIVSGAMFAAISKAPPDTVSFDSSTSSMLNVSSAMNITDMQVYNPMAVATSNQVINVLNALASGKTEVAINKTPEPAAAESLQKAGMNISANAASVSREQAIAAFVRLYELKTKQQIKPTYTVANTPYSGTSSAAAQYQTAMLKAAEIDMLNGQTALRPKDSLNVGELFELADVVIADAGL